jgi:hypothetical protein
MPRVSGRTIAVHSSTTRLAAAMLMKIDSQPKAVSSRPPISGPSVGTTTITVATRPSIEAARLRSNKSRMMARPITMPAEAPSACRMRAKIRPQTLEATIAKRLAAAVSANPAISTGRRPKRSDSGPVTSWPAASASR